MERLSPARAGEILDAVGGVRVLVVGDLMLDRYITGEVERISPEAPVPVVRVDEERYAVGGAANVAANVVALGATCDVVGLVGDDEAGRLLRESLRERGVKVDGLVTDGDRPTTTKIRVLARRQQIVRVDRERDDDVEPGLARALATAILELAGECGAVAVEDYNKGVLVDEVIRAAVGAGGTHDLPSVVDPKKLRFFGYAGATVFKPNAKELADALGDHLHPDDAGWMESVRTRLGCAHLLLTLGERGVALRTDDGDFLRVPAVAHEVFDVSGAGDTVTAVVTACLGAGATPVEAAILANHAAAIEVSKAGVATVSPDEILAQVRAFQNDEPLPSEKSTP